MGSAQGKADGRGGVMETNPAYVESLTKMVNQDYAAFKFVKVPSSDRLVNGARKQLLTMSEEKSRKVLDGTAKLDKPQGEMMGRACLTYTPDSNKSQEGSGKRNFARTYINEMTKEAIFTDRKQTELNKVWNNIFKEMVFTAITDMSDPNTYMKKCMEELEKT